MRELKTEVQIKAPVEEVWKALTQLQSWKDWNPIVENIEGAFELNAKVLITMRAAKGKKPMSYPAKIIEIEESKSYRWRATMMAGFLFTNDKIFILEANEEGTLLTHNEEFTGLLVPLFWNKMVKGALPMLNLMNRALKKSLAKKT